MSGAKLKRLILSLCLNKIKLFTKIIRKLLIKQSEALKEDLEKKRLSRAKLKKKIFRNNLSRVMSKR